MQFIKAGAEIIETTALFGEMAMHMNVPMEAIKVSLANNITEEEIMAMLTNPWQVCDEGGNVLSTQTGYNTLKEFTVTFMKVPDSSAEISTLRTQLTQAIDKAGVYRQALLGVLDQLPEDIKSQVINALGTDITAEMESGVQQCQG